MDSQLIAEVALNLPLRRTFDYRVPEEHAGAIRPGCRVIVPFGNRLKAGVAVALKESSEVPSGKLKALQRPIDLAPAFPPELIAFTQWIADYYFCAWGEVLEAALPGGLGARFRTRYRWREFPPPPGALKGLEKETAALVSEQPSWSDAQWLRRAGAPEARRWLARQLKPGGALEAVHEYAGAKSDPVMERWVLAAGKSIPGKKRRRAGGETQKETVLRVLGEEGAVPMARLKALIKDPGRVVRQLAADGLAVIEERPAAPGEPSPAPAEEPFLELNAEQQAAYSTLQGALSGGGYKGFLLEGVTGSGKTEVYLHAVRETLALGRGALLLVPEIALTEAIVNRFRARFGNRVAVLHSALAERERFEAWNRVRDGRANIVIGARSAVFAPVERLGLVIVDEEHDTSYKQDENPRYNGRDAALTRAFRAGAVALLGSATPSLESERNVELGKLTRLRLTRRVSDRPLPPVEMLDLRVLPRQPGCAMFTKRLIETLRETLLRKEQAILFLNRRGYGALARCTSCEETLLCAHCSISLTYHRAEGFLLCHRCEYRRPLPERCPACDAPAMEVVGLGTERIEQEAAKIFPSARILRMDSDTLRRRGELERMMKAIRERRYDIIIGTQVLSKGHDFPHITLVAAVLADISLNLPDYRAPERTFQILTQMAGRAGRGDQPGRVLIQTYNPDHYSLVHVTGHDNRAFTKAEMAIRAEHGSPPFSCQALVWVSALEPARAQALAGQLAGRLRVAAESGAIRNRGAESGAMGNRVAGEGAGGNRAAGKTVRVLGAAEAPIRKLHGRYRWMILLSAPSAAEIRRVLRAVLDRDGFKAGPRDRIVVDMDPYNLL
ncbi:MAG: primosomal protein N' [SAR324 cluster bacterium]|nr:primosomal protein N' [SAR324 cluster bacterium]